MLNPAYSVASADFDQTQYILPTKLAGVATEGNASTNTFDEYRLQNVYTEEIKTKLDSLGLRAFDWSRKSVLDVCCGTGYLSWHLLKIVRPQQLTLNDISVNELDRARRLLLKGTETDATRIQYVEGDITQNHIPDNSFDVVIGNSYLHHFYHLPAALAQIKRILKPDGLLISLHEPTVAALPLESGSIRSFIRYLSMNDRYVEQIRYTGPDIVLGGGEDVWIFRPEDMASLAENAGFSFVKVQCWHLLRPLTVAKMNLHLSPNRKTLDPMEQFALRTSISTDRILHRILPNSFFGSFCLLAGKQ